MRVLFVCRGNIGRSQMAMEFYNKLHGSGAESAGTVVEPNQQRLGDRPGARVAIEAMKELGIDMSENLSHQLNESDLNNYDRVIVMAEPETIPQWLRRSMKAKKWDVEDPKGHEIERVRELRDQIAKLVASL